MAATAGAATLRYLYLQRGDAAVASGGATVCVARPYDGSRNWFVCRVGGDYRARYGVIINEREAAITRYTGFNRYRVVVRRRQAPLGAANGPRTGAQGSKALG